MEKILLISMGVIITQLFYAQPNGFGYKTEVAEFAGTYHISASTEGDDSDGSKSIHGSKEVDASASYNQGRNKKIGTGTNGASTLLRGTLTEMVKIPAGSFNMGDQTGGSIDMTAIPVHSVYVSEFYMDKYETYWSLWEEVTAWGIRHGYSFNSGQKDNKNTLENPDRHPVMYLTWADAVKYCNARSEMMGFTPCYYTSSERETVYRTGVLDIKDNWVNWSANGFRLPTEAEWEKAARGGIDANFYPWPSTGDTEIKGSNCNYKGSGDPWDQGADNPEEDVPFCTTPVGYYAANGYGLYDMAGNAAEWVWDRGDSAWYSNPGAIVADNHGPTTGNNAANRVYRGSSIDDSAYSMACSWRGGKWLAALAIDYAHIDFGVRTVRVNATQNSKVKNR